MRKFGKYLLEDREMTFLKNVAFEIGYIMVDENIV